MNYIFKNILGTFYFDKDFNLLDKPTDKNPKEPNEKELKIILKYFKNNNFHKDFYKKNLLQTTLDLKDSVKFDTLLIHSVNSLYELETITNKLSKVLRDWYDLYLPEISKTIESHEEFANTVLKKSRDQLLNDLKLKEEDSLGSDISNTDLEAIKAIASQLSSLFKLKSTQEKYIEELMKNCPNIAEVATPLLGAKLITEAHSLKRLSSLPGSTVQILGAEKALFRHLKTGAKMPKHGIIIHHPIMPKLPYKLHGKAARALADKISIASRIDYFKGEFIGDKLKKQIIKKLNTDY